MKSIFVTIFVVITLLVGVLTVLNLFDPIKSDRYVNYLNERPHFVR